MKKKEPDYSNQEEFNQWVKDHNTDTRWIIYASVVVNVINTSLIMYNW